MSGPNLDSDHEIIETIKMFSGDEKEFHQLHSMIMKVSMKRKLTWFQGASFFKIGCEFLLNLLYHLSVIFIEN